MKKNIFLLIILAALTGCSMHGGAVVVQQYPTPQEEAGWIVKGEPVVFEGQQWAAQDYVDILLDSEVVLVGEYNGVQLFVEKIDVRPYDRLYTKFGVNKFRVFTKENDKSKKSL